MNPRRVNSPAYPIALVLACAACGVLFAAVAIAAVWLLVSLPIAE